MSEKQRRGKLEKTMLYLLLSPVSHASIPPSEEVFFDVLIFG